MVCRKQNRVRLPVSMKESDIRNKTNYNLVNGEEIKFEDLFTKDADLKNIVSRALYRALAETQRSEAGRRGCRLDSNRTIL